MSKAASARFVARVTITIAVLLGASLAQAREVSVDPGPMSIDAIVAPPLGFVQWCEREPTDCARGEAGSEARLPSTSTAVTRAYWSAIFAEQGSSDPRSRSALANKISLVGDRGGDVSPPKLTPAQWVQITTINRRINRAVLRKSDQAQYGTADHWTVPSGATDLYGDCEDYVLAKRRALVDAGIPLSTLSIAIARTRSGESHAVLLVDYNGQEFVLDNLSPWVVRWDQLNYEWRERQISGDRVAWGMAAARRYGG